MTQLIKTLYHMPAELREAMRLLVSQGKIASAAAFVRDATREKLEREYPETLEQAKGEIK